MGFELLSSKYLYNTFMGFKLLSYNWITATMFMGFELLSSNWRTVVLTTSSFQSLHIFVYNLMQLCTNRQNCCLYCGLARQLFLLIWFPQQKNVSLIFIEKFVQLFNFLFEVVFCYCWYVNHSTVHIRFEAMLL